MTAAYEPSSASLVQKLRILCQCPTLRRDQFLKPFNAKDAGKPLHILGILVDRPTQSRGTPVGFTAHFCRDVKFHHGIHELDRKSTRLNSSHVKISYAVFCLKKKKIEQS